MLEEVTRGSHSRSHSPLEVATSFYQQKRLTELFESSKQQFPYEKHSGKKCTLPARFLTVISRFPQVTVS